MKKPTKLKLHKVDVCELDKLTQQLIWIWIKIAGNF